MGYLNSPWQKPWTIWLATASPKNTPKHPQSLPSDVPVKLVQQGICPKSLVFVIFPPFVFCISTSPLEDCRPWVTPSSDNPLSGKLFLVDTPQGCHICILTFLNCSIFIYFRLCLAWRNPWIRLWASFWSWCSSLELSSSPFSQHSR